MDLDKDGKIDAREFVLLCQTLNKKDALPPKKVRKAAAAPPAAGGAGIAIVAVAVIALVGLVAYQKGAFDSILKPAKKA